MRQRELSIAKITRPRLTAVYGRKRLFELLDQGRKKPVVWISGPAGSGKTTLVGSYLDARKLPCLWYQVDEGDADIATFFYYLGLAAKKAAPRIKQPLPLFTPEYQFGIPSFAKRYFENLYSRLKPPSVIVFDNYQEVPADSPFHEMIRNGLSEIPQGIKVIVISRTDPLPVFTRLQANAVMETIGWEDLRFTPQETSGAMKLHSGKALPKEKLQQIYEKTQGWAAGMVLVEAAWSGGDGPQASGTMLRGKISDYFAEEVFGSLDEEMQQFLLKTSFFPRMTPRMAEEISGIGRASDLLRNLNRGNYFTERRAAHELTYQYHALFREFLQKQAEQRYSQADRMKFQITAAKLLEKSGQIEDAAELYSETREWDSLVTTILHNARTLINQGRSRTLEEWLIRLPEAIAEQRPWILYWRGMCRSMFNPAEARNFFEKAYGLFEAVKNMTGVFLSWAGIVETFFYEWDIFTPLDRWIAKLRKLLKRSPSFPSEEIEIQVALWMFYALLLRQPHHPELPKWERKLNVLRKKSRDINLQVTMSHILVLYYTWIGDFAKAGMIVSEQRLTSRHGAVAPGNRITWWMMESVYYWFTADDEASRKLVNECLKAAEHFGVHIHDYRILAQGVYSTLTFGDVATAEQYLKRMSLIMDSSRRLDLSQYHYECALMALVQDDFLRSAEHAHTSVNLAIESGAPFPEAITRNVLAQALFECGEHRAANVHLSKAYKIGRQMKSDLVCHKYLLSKSYFSFLRDMDEEQGLKYLKKAMTLGREKKYVNMDSWRPVVMSLLCAKALEHGIEVEYVRDLIRKRNLNPPSPPFAKGGMGGIWMDSWPWPIRINTLGRFVLLKDEKPVRSSGKVQKKPLEMLKALIAFGGRDVQGEQIAAALWPDADGDAAYKAFGITLIRLRELLGVKDAVHLREGNVTLDQRYFWVDTWAFEHMLESSKFGVQSSELNAKRQSAIGNRQSEMNLSLLEKALELYKGPFLGAESAAWAISLRERLRAKFLRAVAVLGKHLEKGIEYQKMIMLSEKALEVDDLAEEFYQRLMQCHIMIGRKAEAAKLYERCRKTLAAAFGVETSEETTTLYRKIKGVS